MSPITIPIQTTRRVLPPGVAYAAGLVCEYRPDLADEVREAVLGDDARTTLTRRALAAVMASQGDVYHVLIRLADVVHYAGMQSQDIAALADLLGLIPRRDKGMEMHARDNTERVGNPTICDVVRWPYARPFVVGLGCPGFAGIWRAWEGADILRVYLREGWGAAWGQANLPGEREAVRRLVPIHAHTVSLDPAARADWTRAHIDALAIPVEAQ